MNYLDTTIALAASDIEYYRTNGHVKLSQVCDAAHIGEFREQVNASVEERKRNIALLPFDQRDTYGKAFLQIMNLWVENPALAKWVLSKRFASVAAQLMGVDHVRIYHDQALFKEPHGGITPWHQDQHYWPLVTDNCITMWMPLMDITTAMGTLNFASGTSSVGYLGDMPISDDSEAYLSNMCKERGFDIVNHGDMSAGDATFHSGWCLHGAPGNQTDTLREVMTIIWYEDNTRVIEKPDPKNRWNKSRENDLATWLPGCKPGELAASPINPKVL
uniref:phytanoyl-CoA dioxygenase family protein n=1 Tax=Ningiella ruwaisensis TaxID=2364274 RepID=UPI00109EEB87|nr:phytanoyl-CoA dioxygenase family protein [Ningiella ruwaisensis]